MSATVEKKFSETLRAYLLKSVRSSGIVSLPTEASNLDEWEKQGERDSNEGKLDHLLAELKDDIKAGRVKPLDEVINEP